MLIWLIAIAVTAIACAALFYAAGPRTVNASGPEMDDPNSHFRLVLAGIDADVAAGKLGDTEALAARGELARDMIRLRAEAGKLAGGAGGLGQGTLIAGLGLVAAMSLGLYGWLGNPHLPAQPLAGRSEAQAQPLDLQAAITRIEAALTADPDDLRGWTVVAPAYVEMGRYGDAVRAYRRILELGHPTADLQTSLAEALLLQADGAGSAEAMDLLRAAMAADPGHAMSRLYLAAELTGRGQYDEAVPLWTAAIDLAQGDEPWLPAARQGLLVAQNDGTPPADADEAAVIGGMVSGLAARLAERGGSIEEWTQLVRAYLVLGDTAAAQAAYEDAVAAYPQAFDRGDLDTLALDAGLTLNGATP